jgi:hypothetical protein
MTQTNERKKTMPGPFTVTAATNSVQLNANRQGEAAFTVFNGSGRPLRGQVRLQAEDPAATGWLSLEGEAERNFDIAAAKQFTVRIQVPPDAPPGSYPFRLDVVGVENPDELYTEGPTVTFQVTEEQEETPTFPWWIVGVVAGVLVVAGIILAIALSNGGDTVTVPNVRGETIPDAAQAIQNQDLQIARIPRVEASQDIAAGSIVRTEPEAGEQVDEGTEVTLVISSGSPGEQLDPDVIEEMRPFLEEQEQILPDQ